MGLRGLLLLIGIAAVSQAAAVVIDKPGVYYGISAERLIINASNVAVFNTTVKGGYVEAALPQGMTAYRIKPAMGCVVVTGRNITLAGVRVNCSSGILVFNSSRVRIEAVTAQGLADLPVYRRGLGIYIYNSSDVLISKADLAYFHDCIYAEYTQSLDISGASARYCRYGAHVMFSKGVRLRESSFSDNYVGVALMYSDDVVVSDVKSSGNREWSEGYGFLLAELRGVVKNCKAVDNVHGFYVMYWGNTALKITNCTVEGNYFGVTLRGRNATGVEFIGNAFRGNVVQVMHIGLGELSTAARFVGNVWGGHVTARPYQYISVFSDLMSASEGALAFLAASPSRFAIDSAMGRVIIVDEAPRPDQLQTPALLLLALLPLVLIWKSK
ncbi:nosD homolog [Pyrobaculum aerophilum str. IM2]|uniref:NosD homolog n=2 Tax=Pyrobaculum aerophilum TaxID=13773 RepID=Q8ZXB6_PYRAE|nr:MULTISPECIES: nitrous oxide reductase family maturation protein NosD [Pyrobaculum]AAL63433.1 nosD homolog [Pyrobaculum aerophilum str. IM2]HII45968.1 nosD [Pyrobaculum aerophilum]